MRRRIRWSGSRAELIARLHSLPGVMSGRLPDHTGMMDAIRIRIGLVLLGKVHQNYITQSEGGSGELGTGPWKPLSPVTLALRQKGPTGPKALRGLRQRLGTMPKHRKALVAKQYRAVLQVYRAGKTGQTLRRQARGLLRLIRPYIARTRYKQLESELRVQKLARAKGLAFTAAASLILRDTGRLLASLGPVESADRILRPTRRGVVIGSNVKYAGAHNRGWKHIPRRQFLPDRNRPIPPAWRRAAMTELITAITSVTFLVRFLGPKASAA